MVWTPDSLSFLMSVAEPPFSESTLTSPTPDTRTVSKRDFNKKITISVPDAFNRMVSVLVTKKGGLAFDAYKYKISLGSKSSKSDTAKRLAAKAKKGKRGKKGKKGKRRRKSR